jgi:APA family basic amino acid/polyamine antiporter
MAGLAAVNLRGVSESVKLNVGLTIIEITGLMLVIVVGLWAFTQGGDNLDFSRIILFENEDERSTFVAVTAATSLAFFAMVGFEDSVNMAEETKDPVRIFPKVLLSGLTIAGVVYVLVSIIAVALVPIGELTASKTPLVDVVEAAAPGLPIGTLFPFITMFAVSNTALINMLMASRLIYGMARQHVLPPVLGSVHKTRRTPWVAILFTTTIAFGLIFYVSAFASDSAISVLGGTTSLLLLAVFALVNVAVLVLRRDVKEAGGHFKTPTALPVIGFIASLYLVTPLSGRPGTQYLLAGILLVIGIVLFGITLLINKQLGIKQKGITDPTQLAELPD